MNTPDSPESSDARNLTRREFSQRLAGAAVTAAFADSLPQAASAATEVQPFGTEFPKLDSLACGEWWTAPRPKQNPPPSLDVPRAEVVAFALYTVRTAGPRFQPFVFAPGKHTVKIGRDKPDGRTFAALEATAEKSKAGQRAVKLYAHLSIP